MKPKPEYDDPGLYLTLFGRRALLIGKIIVLSIVLALALTGRIGAAALAQGGDEWDRSSIVLDGRCLPDGSAEFSVLNHGSDMAGLSAWREYEDDVATTSGSFQLAADQTQVWTFTSHGIPISFEADQRPGHPGNSAPRLTLTCEAPTAVTLRSFAATRTQLLATVCQKGIVVDFQTVKGGHVVTVVREGHSISDSYWTLRHFNKTQRVTVCAGVVR